MPCSVCKSLRLVQFSTRLINPWPCASTRRRYNFWAHSFTKCAQEIENLFTSVSRSCLGTNREQEEAAAAAAAQQQQLKDGAGGVAVRA